MCELVFETCESPHSQHLPGPWCSPSCFLSRPSGVPILGKEKVVNGFRSMWAVASICTSVPDLLILEGTACRFACPVLSSSWTSTETWKWSRCHIYILGIFFGKGRMVRSAFLAWVLNILRHPVRKGTSIFSTRYLNHVQTILPPFFPNMEFYDAEQCTPPFSMGTYSALLKRSVQCLDSMI